jgi:glycosyltransferase involved in cell wall biosynthesis
VRIDLIWIDSHNRPLPDWPLGQIITTTSDPEAVADAVANLNPEVDLFLFWEATLGCPDIESVVEVVQLPGDVWHAGLSLGLGGLPRVMDYVDPVWRFNRDPEPGVAATSWRLSLQACLVRAEVIRQLGGPDPHFSSLTGASLELGHRWIRHGALMRHVAHLIPVMHELADHQPEVPLDDEIRFLRLRYGRMWTAWACWRMRRQGVDLGEIIRAYRRPFYPGRTPAAGLHALEEDVLPRSNPGLNRQNLEAADLAGYHDGAASVSVLIPTLDRYPYLFNLLDQLRSQTIRPLEIIVVDQTAGETHEPDWPQRFPDLPLRVIYRDQAGQCSSRNAGLAVVSGGYVLFLDDDDEIPSDLIARHLAFLHRFGVDASCGVAAEAGAGALPDDFTWIRDSDVFPTNNTMIRTTALRASGLFDLAYERGERADGDLGMRLYLAGQELVLNPTAGVLHLHAPRGGLREHDARVVTRSASRGSLGHRHLLASTEAYLWCRYFSVDQVREAVLIRTLGTLRSDQKGLRRLIRMAFMTLRLPDTRRINRSRMAEGRQLLRDYPSIPAYHSKETEEFLTT